MDGVILYQGTVTEYITVPRSIFLVHALKGGVFPD
jgi:hypothetical protein